MVSVVVMGVSGCGKTSVGQRLAAELGLTFIEGDALHPERNIARMSAGIPLTDEDRAPWLESIGAALAAARTGGGAVATCSALRRSYRSLLRSASGADLLFIHLSGSRAVLERRMRTRSGHFMPPVLLDSQLATLEPPAGEPGVLTLDCAAPLEQIVERALAFIAAARKEASNA